MTDAPQFDFTPYRSAVWRVVESQYISSTIKLVDTLEEQALLEEELTKVKPKTHQAVESLDYLLQRPFLVQNHIDNRFRPSGLKDGIYYASENIETAIAEQVFHRWLFFVEAPEMILPEEAGAYTGFCADIAVDRAVDVNRLVPPSIRQKILHKTDYSKSISFALTVRRSGGEAILYPSVRDQNGQNNIALLTPKGFAKSQPYGQQSWTLSFKKDRVIAQREFPKLSLEFTKAGFNDPRLS